MPARFVPRRVLLAPTLPAYSVPNFRATIACEWPSPVLLLILPSRPGLSGPQIYSPEGVTRRRLALCLRRAAAGIRLTERMHSFELVIAMLFAIIALHYIAQQLRLPPA